MNDHSAMPCGCDIGEGYTCRQHQEDVMRDTVPAMPFLGGCMKYLARQEAPTRVSTLPQDPKERKKYPIATGVLFYFPDAIAAVARVSFEGNEQHNPGEPLHWARGKSMDQEDTLVRHLMESGTFDTDGQRHSAKAAWRALAMLQLEIERDRE